MSETKAFPTADVLGVITERLLGPIQGIYEVLGYMSGGPVWTHQIPRISREACPVILAQRPELAVAREEAEQVTPENYGDWLATWIARYGPEITVPRMAADEHENIDPLSELAEKVHPDRIVVVTKEPPHAD